MVNPADDEVSTFVLFGCKMRRRTWLIIDIADQDNTVFKIKPLVYVIFSLLRKPPTVPTTVHMHKVTYLCSGNL